MQSAGPHPELIRASTWAGEHLALLVAAWSRFEADGEWPKLGALQRAFERSGIDIDVGQQAWEMPNALGFVEMERLVLRVRGLSFVEDARPLLQKWASVLGLAYQRYVGDEEPMLRRVDLAEVLHLDEWDTDRVGKLLLRESWAFGSGRGDQGDLWEREVGPQVRAARSSADLAEILAARDDVEFPPPSKDEQRSVAPTESDRLPTVEPSLVVRETQGMSHPVEQPGHDVPTNRAVMVVHGRNEPARLAMFSFLRAIGLRPLEWSTLVAGTNKAAPYIGEVLDHAFDTAAAVVVLFTPDDEARLRESFQSPHDPADERELTPQARPNVLFEAGMAIGLHPDRTVLVELGRLRAFSDIYGRHVVRLNGTEKPLRDIARRLQTAGCEVDLSGDDWASPGQFPESIPEAQSGSTSELTRSNVLREIEYLHEDLRRWLEDRDLLLRQQTATHTDDMAARGLFHSGINLGGLAGLKRDALHEYRDEVTRKRRRYRELCDAAPAGVELPRFVLDDASSGILAKWRGAVSIGGLDTADVNDPTDPSREPSLRRFELEGDACERD